MSQFRISTKPEQPQQKKDNGNIDEISLLVEGTRQSQRRTTIYKRRMEQLQRNNNEENTYSFWSRDDSPRDLLKSRV